MKGLNLPGVKNAWVTTQNRPDAVLQRYHYDAADRLSATQPPSQLSLRRFYSGAVLSNQQGSAIQLSYLNMGGLAVGIHEQASGPGTVRLLGAEQQRSVLRVFGGDGQQNLAYTPHGEGADRLLPGFNGEQPDPLTGNYLLGNGYRAYSPALMRFFSPDSFSPFGEGGLNPYTYCLGDPVNRADPTGHISWQGVVGIGLGVLGLAYGGYALAFSGVALTTGLSAASVAVAVSAAAGLGATGTGIAQVIVEAVAPESSAASTLGWISLGLGATSLFAGISANARSPVNQSGPERVSAKVSSRAEPPITARVTTPDDVRELRLIHVAVPAPAPALVPAPVLPVISDAEVTRQITQARANRRNAAWGVVTRFGTR